jgi:hypothetical protein
MQPNRMLAAAIPEITTDSTREKLFSAEWTAAEVDWLKDHIRKGLGSASGEDAIHYAEIMDNPNDDLLLLCNERTRNTLSHTNGPFAAERLDKMT